jgi:O-antigen/teichoic acid export membrane protein
VTNFIFIPKYSYYGAAGTTLLTELTVTLLMVLVLGRILKKLPSFGSIIKYALAGLIMAASLYLLPAWNLFLLIVLAGSIYFLSLYLIGGFSIKHILALVRKDV